MHIFLQILILCTLSLAGSFAYAAPSYSVTPLVIDEEVEPREIIEHTITLKNTSDIPASIYPTVNNIAVGEGGGIEEFLPQVMSDKSTSLASWIEIGRGGIDLMPGQTKTVILTLRINPGAMAGEYHAFVGFPYGGNRDEAERMVERGDAPGTVVTITIVDKKTTLLKLSRFIVDRFVTKLDNTSARYTVSNPGDEPLVPQGEVIFYDNTGKEVGAVEVNPQRETVPPGEERVFSATVPIDGLFGKYKAFLSVEYGTGNVASVQDTTFFYAVPLKALMMMLAALTIIVACVSWYVHRRYFDEAVDDGSELLHVHVREGTSDPLHHDIDLRSS